VAFYPHTPLYVLAYNAYRVKIIHTPFHTL